MKVVSSFQKPLLWKKTDSSMYTTPLITTSAAEHRQPSLRRVKENDDQPPARGGVGVSVVWGGGEGGGLVGRGGEA